MSAGGRPALTSAHELAAIAQDLFLRRGFDEVGVDDIAEAAGISRRTFFRYFSTKADVLWVESPTEIGRLRDLLAAEPAGAAWNDALCRAAPAALHHSPEQRTWALQRAHLILTVPAVQQKAAIRHAEWRHTATAFVARCRGTEPDDIVAVTAGHAVLAATLAAHEYWVAHPEQDLRVIMERTLRMLVPDPALTEKATGPHASLTCENGE